MITSTRLIASLLFAWLAVVDGWLGIFFTDNSNEARIADVIPDSPADKAGLKPGDLITAIDDQTVADRDTLVTAIRAAKTGQRVKLKVDRAGKEMTFVVKLGERPAEDQIPSPKEQPAKKGAGGAPAAEAMPAAPPFLGVQLEEEDGAVRIARVVPGSPAAAAGLAEGERIVKWGDAAITSTAQIEQQMAKAKAGDEVVLQLRNEQSTRSVRVKLGARDGDGLRARSAPPVAVDEPAEEPKKPPKAKKEKDATKPKKAAGDAMGKPFGTDFAAALRAAEKSGKRVFVVYGASSDGGSQAQRRALHDEQLAEPLGDFVCVYVDAGDNGDLLHERDVRELPTLEILRGGKTLSRRQGYLPVAGLLDFLRGGHPEAEDMPAVTEERPASPHRSDEAALQKELQRLRAEVAELRKLVEELRKQTSGRE
jgi:membrane-associated protease RseP (regulator of RpoE activity)